MKKAAPRYIFSHIFWWNIFLFLAVHLSKKSSAKQDATFARDATLKYIRAPQRNNKLTTDAIIMTGFLPFKKKYTKIFFFLWEQDISRFWQPRIYIYTKKYRFFSQNTSYFPMRVFLLFVVMIMSLFSHLGLFFRSESCSFFSFN